MISYRLIHLLLIPVLMLLLVSCEFKPSLNIGDSAPEFTITKATGGSISLEELRGEVVALRFWQESCPTCIAEMPLLSEIVARYGERFRLIAINMGDSKEAVLEFKERFDISYTLGLDSKQEVAAKYGVVAVPTTYIIDKEGIIREKIFGESDMALFSKQILRLQ